MEACDDIAYSIIDAEDTVKKGYASFYDLMDHLESEGATDQVITIVAEASRRKNAEFRKEKLSSRELNDLSMTMFRVKAISEMIVAATTVFVDNIDKMMAATIEPGFELIRSSKCAALCAAAKSFDNRHGFQHREVLRLELRGNNYIKSMMTMLWNAVSKEDGARYPFERYVFGEISENYRRVYEASDKSNYAKWQLVCDALSGMTEPYLVRKNDEYKSLNNG